MPTSRSKPTTLQNSLFRNRDGILSALKETGWVSFQGLHGLSDEDLIQWAAHMSSNKGDLRDKLLHWDFGPLLHMKMDPQAQNYLFSTEEVPLHWDGAFHIEPRFLLFHCGQSSGTGGETLFCDTTEVFEALTVTEQEQAQKIHLEFETEKKAHYGGRTCQALVQTHPLSGRSILRYADEVDTELNPVTRRITQGSAETLRMVQEKIHQATVAHSWSPGDLLIVDNHRFVHGRRALGPNVHRQFRRIQIL